jgi:hypothetical protein
MRWLSMFIFSAGAIYFGFQIIQTTGIIIALSMVMRLLMIALNSMILKGNEEK